MRALLTFWLSLQWHSGNSCTCGHNVWSTDNNCRWYIIINCRSYNMLYILYILIIDIIYYKYNTVYIIYINICIYVYIYMYICIYNIYIYIYIYIYIHAKYIIIHIFSQKNLRFFTGASSIKKILESVSKMIKNRSNLHYNSEICKWHTE